MAVGSTENSRQFLPQSNEECIKTGLSMKFPALTTTEVEPVGRWFEAFAHRRHHNHTLSHHSWTSAGEDEDEEELSDNDNDDQALIKTLDPKEWKKQDHYAVLGLKDLRYKATEDEIKAAYKKKVLKHHPDKRKTRGLEVKDGDDDYFTCITRAFEILGTSKRRSYDSVDPEFDEDVPSPVVAGENFYDVFNTVFERNARWSVKKNVPKLGLDGASYDEVNHFYSFWYDFESWREFSYLDEEEKEKGENRDERRWIEKQNKAARQKRKKEEVSRIRQLVDNAYNCDPRIQRFKEEEKQKKLAQKKAKQDAARAKAEQEEKLKQEALEAERLRKQKEEEEARKLAEAAKKERDAQKKAIKKERKIFRTTVKEYDYFTGEEAEKIDVMADVDKLAELLSITSLQELNKTMTAGDRKAAADAFFAQVEEVNNQLEEEKKKNLEAAQQKSRGGSSSSTTSQPWSEEEIAALIKGVKTFPAGTVQRWETIANFIQQHVETSVRTAKEVLGKAKDLQKNEASQVLRQDVNKKAYDKFEQSHKAAGAADKSAPSQRLDSIGVQQIGATGSNPAPWSAEEQKLLEQALKTYPASTPERWDRIAETIPSRSKKDCMIRYKELVELVKAKKAAQTAAKLKK